MQNQTAKAAPSPSPNLEERKATQYPFMSLWVKKVQAQTLQEVSGSCGKVLSCSGGKMFSG